MIKICECCGKKFKPTLHPILLEEQTWQTTCQKCVNSEVSKICKNCKWVGGSIDRIGGSWCNKAPTDWINPTMTSPTGICWSGNFELKEKKK